MTLAANPARMLLPQGIRDPEDTEFAQFLFGGDKLLSRRRVTIRLVESDLSSQRVASFPVRPYPARREGFPWRGCFG